MSCRLKTGVLKQAKVLISAAAFLFLLCPGAILAESQSGLQPQGPWEKFKIQLTPEEIEWVTNHPVVRLGFDPNWPPFSFRDDKGTLQGIDFDLLARLEERLGIHFEPLRTDSWEGIEHKILTGDVDVVSGISRTESREKHLLFTSAYFNRPVAVITRKEAPFLTSLYDLKNVTLASPRGFVTTHQLMHDFPGLPLIQTPNSLDALKLVSGKKADVAVENLAAASYIIKSAGLTNLKIAGIADYNFDLCLGVRKDWPELRSILQKGLDSLPEAERRQISDHWAAVEYFPHFDWLSICIFGSAFLLLMVMIFGAFTWWNRHLARELAERRKAESALKAAHDRLHELNCEKDRFMSMAAHDLNNPLTAIMMKCGLFETVGFTPESARDLLATVQNGTQRMSHLIKNLLNANKIEHGRMQLHSLPLDLSELMTQTIECLQPCADFKKIRFEYTQPPAQARIRGDRDAILQVLENLLSNALKFTPPGKSVAVRVALEGGVARVEVRDQGPGISEEDRQRLFEKYITLSARPTGNETSNGLGLSIAKSLVDAMKGAIRCESKSGEGALFVVEFPMMAGVS